MEEGRNEGSVDSKQATAFPMDMRVGELLHFALETAGPFEGGAGGEEEMTEERKEEGGREGEREGGREGGEEKGGREGGREGGDT